MTVLDVGAGDDPDPRADITLDLFSDADVRADLESDWPLEANCLDGVVAHHVVEHLSDPDHFFRESGRVLRPEGWLEVTVPVGADARADPDHEQVWTWRTPAIYCRDHSDRHGRPWDPDPPFVLQEREADVWLFRPFEVLSPILDWAADRWPAEAVQRCSSGEIRARYRRVTA